MSDRLERVSVAATRDPRHAELRALVEELKESGAAPHAAAAEWHKRGVDLIALGGGTR